MRRLSLTQASRALAALATDLVPGAWEGIKECELVQWFVKEGDAVEEFGRICEVQSDKATVEITSPFAGTVRHLHHQPGDVVQVGAVLADIHAEGAPPGEPDEQLATPAADESAPRPPPVTTHGPEDLGAGKVLTSPAVRSLAQEHGIDLKLVTPTGPGARVTKGDVLAFLDSLSSAPTSTVTQEVTEAVPTTAEQALRKELPPHHAHVAQPLHPATSQPPPLAPGAGPPESAAAREAGTAGPAPAPTLLPLRGYRKAMVRSMEAAGKVPHFHLCEEVDVGRLVELREEVRGDPALGGIKLTYMPFFIKAAALALREYPLVNSSLAPDESAIIQHNVVNTGIAVNTPYGLAVPNIKNVQLKSVAVLAQELLQLQRAAADNKLRQEDIRGGTFTISNIGTIGGTYAAPLINPPEVAIMALGKIQRLPRFAPDGASVAGADILSISLGADHRVVDGATLAGFAKAWRHFIECPGSLLLHLQ
ncbi:hypothetical protein N2152v2_008392 [Parachlorella kessleri]